MWQPIASRQARTTTRDAGSSSVRSLLLEAGLDPDEGAFLGAVREALTDYRRSSPTAAPATVLTPAELELLREGGLDVSPPRPDEPDAVAATAARYAALLADSLDVATVARRLGVTGSRVRQMLAARELYGIRAGATWRIPAFQLAPDLHGITLSRPARDAASYPSGIMIADLEGRPAIVHFGLEGTFGWLDLATGVAIGEWHTLTPTTAAALVEIDGKPVVVAGGSDGTIHLLALATRTSIDRPVRVHDGIVTSISTVWLAGRSIVVSGGEDGWIRLFDPANGRLIGNGLDCHSRVNAITSALHDDRVVIVSAGEDGMIRRFDLATGEAIGAPIRADVRRIYDVAVADTEGRVVIVSAGENGMIRRFDLATGEAIGAPILAQSGWVNAVVMGRLDDRQIVVSAGADGTIRRFDIATGAQIGEPLVAHRGFGWAVAVDELDGRQVIVSTGADGVIRRFDLDEAGAHRVLPGLAAVVSALPQELHPVAVANWLTTPCPDLELDGRAVSPIEWLEAGGDPERAAALAADL